MHTTHSNTQYKNESSTVKWAQWDKTQSRELLVCSYVCASHGCAQLLHTILHRTDLIVFLLTLQTITTAPMMSMEWGQRWRDGDGDKSHEMVGMGFVYCSNFSCSCLIPTHLKRCRPCDLLLITVFQTSADFPTSIFHEIVYIATHLRCDWIFNDER